MHSNSLFNEADQRKVKKVTDSGHTFYRKGNTRATFNLELSLITTIKFGAISFLSVLLTEKLSKPN